VREFESGQDLDVFECITLVSKVEHSRSWLLIVSKLNLVDSQSLHVLYKVSTL
jgi:hypothetical protein